jgi:hypothetical protein
MLGAQAFVLRPLLNEPPSPERLPAPGLPAASSEPVGRRVQPAPCTTAGLGDLAAGLGDPALGSPRGPADQEESPNTGALKRRIAVNALLGLAESGRDPARPCANPAALCGGPGRPGGAGEPALAGALLLPSKLTLPAAALRRSNAEPAPAAGQGAQACGARGALRSGRPPRPPA